jgi:hypothetical protein
MLYPQTITSIRHVWTHPDIDEEDAPLSGRMEKAEVIVRNWLDTSGGPSYEEFLFSIPAKEEFTSEYLVMGVDAYGEIPDYIWDQMEIILGRKFKVRPTSFSCSC